MDPENQALIIGTVWALLTGMMSVFFAATDHLKETQSLSELLAGPRRDKAKALWILLKRSLIGFLAVPFLFMFLGVGLALALIPAILFAGIGRQIFPSAPVVHVILGLVGLVVGIAWAIVFIRDA